MYVPASEPRSEIGVIRVAKAPLFSAFAVLFALGVIFGFLNFLREPPSGDFHAEWMAMMFLCVSAVALAPLLPARVPVSPALVAWPVGLMLLLIVHQVALSIAYPQSSLFWAAYLFLALLSSLLGQAIRAAELAGEVASRIAWVLLIAATLNGLIQFAQAARVESYLAPFAVPLVEKSLCRMYGNIGQANQASTLSWLGIGAALYLHGVGRLSSRLAILPLAIMLIGSALTASRMAWLFLGILVAMVLFLRAWPSRDSMARLLVAVMLVCGFVAANYGAALVLSGVDEKCISGLDRLASSGGGTGTLARLDLWRQAIDVWWTSPLIGVGAYQFLPTVYRIEDLALHRPLDTYVHNSALQILAEFGLLGFGVIGFSLFVCLRGVWSGRARLQSRDAFFLLVLGIIGVHALLEFSLHYTYFLMLAGLVLGMLIDPESSGSKKFSMRARPALMALAASLLAGGVVVFDDYRKLDRLFWLEDQRVGFSAAPTPEVRKLLTEAANEVWIFGAYRDHLLGLSDPITKEDIEGKIERTDRLLSHAPQAVVMARRAMLAVLAEDLESARLHIRRMFGFYPAHAEELRNQMYRFVQDRSDEFLTVAPIIEEELARRPRPRW